MENFKPIHVSFSGGRSSAYMLHILLQQYEKKELIISFANTGKEKLETLDFVQQTAEYFEVEIIWIEATFEKWTKGGEKSQRKCIGFKEVTYQTASRKGEPFAAMMDNFGVPNRMNRFCTEYLKVIPMRRHLESLGLETQADYLTAMGIRIDEAHRAKKFKDSDYIFPLIDFRVTNLQVRDFWKNMPFDLKLKDYQGNCDLCQLKSIRKRKTILRENPSIGVWWSEQEKKHERTFDYGLSVKDIQKLANRRFHLVKDIYESSLLQTNLFNTDIACFCGD